MENQIKETKAERRAKLLDRMRQDYLKPDAKNDYVAVEITKDLLPQIQEIDKASYYEELGEDGYAEIPVMEEWLAVNPDMYPAAIASKKTGKVEAYICLSPLKPDVYQKFKNGEILDIDLEASDITPFQKGKNDCLQMDVASRQKKLPRDGAILLLDTFEKKIASLAKEGKYINNVLYDICSQMGFDSANLIADIEKVGETHYKDVPMDVSGMYEGRLHLSQKIEQTMQSNQEQTDDRTL